MKLRRLIVAVVMAMAISRGAVQVIHVVNPGFFMECSILTWPFC